jgi:hypothetical protein
MSCEEITERKEMTDRIYKSEWTEEIEKQLKYLGECAQGYVRMYKMDILRYSNLQQRWTQGGISAGILGAALLTMALSLGVENSQIMIIVSTFLSFGTSVCQGYLYQVDYATILADLKRQASKYSGLQNNIKRQLSMPRNKREKAEDYHYWITNNYDQLGETSLNIHPDTVEKYRNICEKDNLPFPDENAADARIVIHKDQDKEILPVINSPLNSTMVKNIDKHLPPRNSLLRISLEDVLAPQDRETLVKGSSLKGQLNIQEALGYTDQHMRYELTRLARQGEE